MMSRRAACQAGAMPPNNPIIKANPTAVTTTGRVILRLKTISRSEEHTSELQSPCNLVCRLLLEKKKNTYEIQSPCNITCRLLREKKTNTLAIHRSKHNMKCHHTHKQSRHTTLMRVEYSIAAITV